MDSSRQGEEIRRSTTGFLAGIVPLTTEALSSESEESTVKNPRSTSSGGAEKAPDVGKIGSEEGL
jgi:hypothetical protein